jgi:hypothetical protein
MRRRESRVATNEENTADAMETRRRSHRLARSYENVLIRAERLRTLTGSNRKRSQMEAC